MKAVLDGVTSDVSKGVPGLVFVAVDKTGNPLVEHASGNVSIASKEPMTLDTVFWIASCTKLITTIACMQLVEQGKLALDDADLVEKIAPELRDVKVFENGKLVAKEGRITLRMLLAHTAGFGYTFFDARLTAYGRPVGLDEFTGDAKDILSQPLVNQPGKVWEYGVNLDWAGVLVERVSGLKLNAYFHKYIFEPLGLENITMFPGKEMKAKLAHMHQRGKDGSMEERDHLYRRPLMAETQEEKDRIFNSGGAGCFATPTDYSQILAVFLNNGKSPKTGHQLLKSSTIYQMWENQIPDQPNFARGGPPAAKPDLSSSAPELYPQEGNPPQGWGLSFFLTITPGATGRGANTAWWAGLSNLFWWVDREKGVAGIIASQILPFGEMGVLGSWIGAEKAVYDNLE